MEEDNKINNITAVVVSLIRLSIDIKDNFFAEKLNYKIHNLLRSYIKLQAGEAKYSVAQYFRITGHVKKNSADLIELIDCLLYLENLTLSPAVLSVKKNLFDIIVDTMNQEEKFSDKTKKEDGNSKKLSLKITKDNKKVLEEEPLPEVQQINPNKEKIIDFIKKYPNARTKDIVYEFSAVSDRTVKRNLMELTRDGLIRKRIRNRATHYSTAK